MALSPIHYWTFATASGDLSVADTVGTLNFSSAVNDGGGFPGPEVNTTAQRLYADQIWTTPALNANAWTNQTWMILLSQQPTGGYSSFTDIFGWGDPSNRTARGFRIGMLSSSTNTGQMHIVAGGNTPTAPAMPFPQTGWHLAYWSIQPSPAQLIFNLDSQTNAALGVSFSVPPINTDQLWIQSAQPVVIAHIAAFNYVVTPTQMQTIYQQIVNWPTTVPINMPVQGGVSGPVTIEPTDPTIGQVLNNQATFMPQITDMHTEIPLILSNQGTFMPQITDIHTLTPEIHTDTQNIVNTLFPQLETPLNFIADTVTNILNGITTTITGVGGAVSKTLGDLFSGKTLDLLTTADLGSVCAPDALDVSLTGGEFFGIQATCTSFADWYVFTGPGDTYVTQSLGTLEITRGGSLELRVGLHTTTHTVYPLPGLPNFSLDIGLPNVPLDYHVSLVPAPETCWHLVALEMP